MKNSDEKVHEISKIVPREVIVTVFGGILALDPETFNMMVEDLAASYDVSVEALGLYISEVLRSLPSNMD